MAIAFKPILKSDIPLEWLREPPAGYLEEVAQRLHVQLEDLAVHLCVELPDLPICWEYEKWLATQDSRDTVGVIISSVECFVQKWGTDKFLMTTSHLKETGNPFELWAETFSKKPGEPKPAA